MLAGSVDLRLVINLGLEAHPGLVTVKMRQTQQRPMAKGRGEGLGFV